MKNLLKGSLGTLAIAPLLLLGAIQDPTGTDDTTALKAEVERQAVVIQEMANKVNELGKLAEETTAYLAEQSQAARGLVLTLSTSEEEGFTAGINPNSRKTMLGGFRAYLASQQAGIPSAKKKATKEK